MSNAKGLRVVTDSFSLVDNIRKHTPHNGRKYIVSAVRATLESPEVKERIALGEMFGYYGHTNRALYHKETGSLDLPESCTVTIDGQKIVLMNVPSNRTLEIEIDDNAIVTHTQELLDTDPGRIVDGMERSQAGGWSWATKGGDYATMAMVNGYSGMDYVGTPNYVSLNRNHAMMESVGNIEQWRIDSLINAGYSQGGASELLAHMVLMQRDHMMLESAHRLADYETQNLVLQGRMLEMQEAMRQQIAMLESASQIQSRRQELLQSAHRHLPVFMTDKQKTALLNMATPDDLVEVTAMFESINGGGLQTLPLGRHQQTEAAPPSSRNSQIGSVPTILPVGMSLL